MQALCVKTGKGYDDTRAHTLAENFKTFGFIWTKTVCIITKNECIHAANITRYRYLTTEGVATPCLITRLQPRRSPGWRTITYVRPHMDRTLPRYAAYADTAYSIVVY